MKRLLTLPAALAAVLLAGGAAAQNSNRPAVSKATVDGWMKSLSNWGRWGKTDELGSLNLITAETRKQAAALVKEGFSVSMARDTERTTAIDNPSPFKVTMNEIGNRKEMPFAVDTYEVLYHGYAHTHIDSPGHLTHNGQIFNGFPAGSITKDGMGKLAVTQMKNGVFARGILMDIPKLKGVPYLEPGAKIYPEDLEAWEKKAGFKVRSGDVVLIRTGRWARRAAKGPWDVSKLSAGLDATVAPWLKARDVAILGSDAASDVAPSGIAGVDQPIHLLVLVAMGMPILDNCDFEAVSEAAAKRNRWEFLLTANPLRVIGGSGSPVNPIATF